MISVIIPTYNKASRLKFCLKHLLSCKTNYNFEIIVINDGSTDETSAVLQNFLNTKTSAINMKIFNLENKGRATARNFGVDNARYNIILFLDDDVIIDRTVIDMHVFFQKSSCKRVVHGMILHTPYMKAFKSLDRVPYANNQFLFEKYRNLSLNFNTPPQKERLQLDKHAKFSAFEAFVKKEVLEKKEFVWTGFVGANTSVNRHLFQKAGGFDNSFGLNWGCEDLEFGYRLDKKFDVEFIYDTSTRSYHLDHYSKQRKIEHSFNMKYFYEKYNDVNIIKLNDFLDRLI